MTRNLRLKSIPPAVLWTAAALVSAVFIAMPVLAAGPTLNIFPVGYSGAQNTDYPLLDARDFSQNTSFSSSQADHDDGVTANPGDTLEFIVYYHNGAADDPDNTAHNVRISASLPSGESFNHTVSATISADNATSVYSSDANRGGNVTVHISGTAAQSLQYIPGSTTWYKERSTVGESMPDGIVTGGVNIGDVRGCWNFSGFVRFRVRVGSQSAVQPQLSITKTVATSGSSFFSHSITANPGQIVDFKIQVRATQGAVNNLSIRDIIPPGLIYLSNTTRVNGVLISDSSGFTAGGYDYGTLAQDQTVEVTFSGQLASQSYFGTSSQTVTNTANARGSNVATVQDTADIRVQGTVASSSFELRKSAYNQTQGMAAQSVQANPGDVITYTLTYRNNGSVEITGAVIFDSLSDVLLLADVTNTGEGSMSGNTIIFPTITVPAGVSIDKTFQVRVKDFIPATSDLTMTNIYGNQVDIYVRLPTVKGTYYAPKTGPGENMAIATTLAAVTAFYFHRRGKRVAAT